MTTDYMIVPMFASSNVTQTHKGKNKTDNGMGGTDSLTHTYTQTHTQTHTHRHTHTDTHTQTHT